MEDHSDDKPKGRLPEGMGHCTIRFKECHKGHGRLTADNWIDHGCPHCKIEILRNALTEIYLSLPSVDAGKKLNFNYEDFVDSYQYIAQKALLATE